KARIALGRTGIATPLKEVLDFKMCHAHARDAVYSVLELNELEEALQQFHSPVIIAASQASERSVYLQRPDHGRNLDKSSANNLKNESSYSVDVSITIADGLSATAINKHAVPVLKKLIPLLKQSVLTIAPIVIARQARVAIADEIGSLLNAKLSLILIGERPGLSSPDSMGAYITYNPSPGTTDESRNCVSNIRPEGLNYDLAAERIAKLIKASLQLKLSGIMLKDEDKNLLQ
ncbi:MAG TPA: ethanolamine ammonia-lyase subunit EutC, partial [Chitinophagaceae bacterium]|nr:ethanolamine ammonia-lyase subunit EutC [Chitinophagaceae bacterium]